MEIGYNTFIMNKNNFLNTLLTADILYEKYSRDYRRLILLNVLLYVAIFLAALFSLLNIFKNNDYLVAALDSFVMLSLFYACRDVHTSKRHKKRPISL